MLYSCIQACLLLKKIEVVLMTSKNIVKSRLLTTKQFMDFVAKTVKFLETRIHQSKHKVEFLSQTLQESPREHKLRTQPENSKKKPGN